MPTVVINKVNDTTGKWEPCTVDAIGTSTPGLVVTRAQFLEPGYTRWWTVTHTGSGLHIPVYFPTSERAVDFAGDIATVADWTRPHEELKNLMGRDDTARHAFLRAKARHGGLFNFDLEPDYTPAPAAA